MVSEQEKTEDNDWRIPLADVVTRLNDFGKANRSFRVVDDESEHKADFLSDPDHQQWPQKHYPKLDQTDFTSALDELRQIREAFVDSDVPEKYLPVYLARVDEKISFIQLMSYAKQFHDDPNDLNIVERFRRQNIELYGSPDRQTYETLLSGKLRIIRDKI